MVALAGTAPSLRKSNEKRNGPPLAALYRSDARCPAELSRNVNRGFLRKAGNWREGIWFRDVDSNHDTQLQRLMSYRLDDPGPGSISVADARKCAQAAQIHGLPPPQSSRCSPTTSVSDKVSGAALTNRRKSGSRPETFSITCT